MRFTKFTTLLACSATLVAAQGPFYANQTGPFSLVLQSRNDTYNGKSLYSCHEGAAIEGLCIGGDVQQSSKEYFFNYTTQQTPDPVLGYQGILTWVLHGGNFNLSEALQISPNPTSDLVVPLFYPGDNGVILGFDKEDKLFLFSFRDDSVSPPVYKVTAEYHWYVCLTQAGYLYTTLAWSLHYPKNPTCVKVDVKRVFV